MVTTKVKKSYGLKMRVTIHCANEIFENYHVYIYIYIFIYQYNENKFTKTTKLILISIPIQIIIKCKKY